jgi:hypothetical protein
MKYYGLFLFLELITAKTIAKPNPQAIRIFPKRRLCPKLMNPKRTKTIAMERRLFDVGLLFPALLEIMKKPMRRMIAKMEIT